MELPQLSGEDGAEVNLDVVGMSWDPSGRRLAIVLDGSSNGGGDVGQTSDKGGAHRGGRVALYAVRTRPVVTASLLGYVEADGVGSDAGGANALWASLFGDGRSGWADAAADESPNKTHAGSQWSVSGALAAAPGVGESTGRLAIAVDE